MAMFVPVKIMTILMSVIFVLSTKTGFCMKQTGTCVPFCTESECITVNYDRVDFKTAREGCHDRNGELVTFQRETDKNTLDILSQELNGDFWIGLRLPASACSNLSTPLRGYEWTSDSADRGFFSASNTWKNSVEVCSPRCVSLSNDQKWTERLCLEKTDGFLCRTKHKDACQAQELSDAVVFPSMDGCLSGLCEHTCTDVKGGYKCSCFKGYISDSKDPRQCKMHCAQQKCPAICDGHTDSACSCPVGFIATDKICEDIDECSMEQCDQECKNTFGSFVCSCKEGFVLKDEVKCIKTPISIGVVKPARNNTLQSSAAASSGFLWLWIFVAVPVVVLILVIRFYVVKRQKCREQNSIQQSTVPVDNVKCFQYKI